MTVLDELERCWPQLETDEALAAAAAGWSAIEPAMTGLGDVAAIRAALGKDPAPAARRHRDAVLHVLLRRGRTEEPARRLLLQLLIPTCRRLARRLWLADPDDREQLVLTELIEMLDGWAEPPRRCQALLLAQRLRRRVFSTLYAQYPPQWEVLDGLRPDDTTTVTTDQAMTVADRLLGVLVDATRRGLLPTEHAQLIVDRRLRGIRLADTAAARTGTSYAAVQRRFTRAEHRLVAACQQGVLTAA